MYEKRPTCPCHGSRVFRSIWQLQVSGSQTFYTKPMLHLSSRTLPPAGFGRNAALPRTNQSVTRCTSREAQSVECRGNAKRVTEPSSCLIRAWQRRTVLLQTVRRGRWMWSTKAQMQGVLILTRSMEAAQRALARLRREDEGGQP